MDQLGNEDFEVNYERCKVFANKVYQEYEKHQKQMWSKLNSNILEPFAKALMEHENIALKGQDELVQTIRDNLEQQMQKALDNFWHSNSVSEALISLEMCKEKFKAYEGHKWNMDMKTPLERTRPIRMRLKEHRLRSLQAQLNSQNKQLEEVLQENGILRQNIRDIKNQRSCLREDIGKIRKKFDLSKAEIMEKQQKKFSEINENVDPNINTEDAVDNAIQYQLF